MLQIHPILKRSDMIRCALCADAPCDAVCEKVKPASLLRSVWFLNEQTAAQRLANGPARGRARWLSAIWSTGCITR